MKGNIIKCVFAFFVVCVLKSCSADNRDSVSVQGINKNDSVIVVDLDQNEIKNICYTSSFFKRATPIILEDTEDALIGSIDKFVSCNELFIVLDLRISKGVFVFGKDGKFIRKIGCVGQGPGEYRSPFDFTVDYDNDVIYVMDGVLQRIFSYKLSDGRFLKSIEIQDRSVRSHYIQYIDGKLYANAESYVETDNDYLLREIDWRRESN